MRDFGIDCHRDPDGVAWVTLRNPARRNAVRLEMWEQLFALAGELTADSTVRVIVLRGHGTDAFASGADISEFQTHRKDAASAAAYEATTVRTFAALLALPQPVVAMLQGFCVGGGLAIALCADLRVAADNSTLQLPAARLGLGYHMSGIDRLLQVVGPAAAAEIFFTARRYTAAEAHHMGLVNHVRPVAEFDAFVAEYIGSICENAPMTVATELRAIDEAMKPESQRDLALIQTMVDRCFASEDYKEGRTAFMEKRKPQFKGR